MLHPTDATARHLLRQAAHRVELLHERIDIRRLRAAAARNPTASVVVEQHGLFAFLTTHRVVNRPHLLHHLLHLRPGHAAGLGEVAHARDHPHHLAHAAQFPDLIHLRHEVIERQLALHHLFLLPLQLIFIELVLDLLDESHQVARAENALGGTFGAELFEAVEFLADAEKLDGLAGDVLGRQQGTAARVGVELGEDQAIKLKAFVEALCGRDGVLAGHAVEHEVNLMRAHRLVDVGQLGHQLIINR